ncbi:uncharacterized mitochondrial protein AtMg00810-like [Nicotiana sylvestris]|uniref:uncharacterized mitochondrial protein AtMg00810-like n=1 Tax=Nicotiana sylvestris TaxID=4096 RepID=UPI00388C8ABD
MVLVYVDDMLITGDNLKLIKETKAGLQQVFKMKDLGELKYFLGIEFARSSQRILMHQRKYTLELISETGLGAAKPAITPLDFNMKLTTKEYDEHTNKGKEVADGDEELSDLNPYQKLIGKLLYLTMTRPDIAFNVQTLSQFLQKPKRYHMEAALGIGRYLKQQPGQGIILSSKNSTEITAYCDADWATCPHSRKSISGYLIKLGESLVSWKSKKQTTVSRSSAEAEYRSLASTLAELIWLVGLLTELKINVKQPVSVYSDIKAVMQIAANLVYHEYLNSKLGTLNIFTAPSLRGSVEKGVT